MASHANAMKAQNVMWNVTGADGNVTSAELKYSDVMNVGSEYMLTNAYGALMLDSNMMSTLRLDSASGTGDDFFNKWPNKAQFIDAMMGVDAYTDGTETAGKKASEYEYGLDEESAANSGSKFTTSYNSTQIKNKAGVPENRLKYVSSDNSDDDESGWFGIGGTSVDDSNDYKNDLRAGQTMDKIVTNAATDIDSMCDNLHKALKMDLHLIYMIHLI